MDVLLTYLNSLTQENWTVTSQEVRIPERFVLLAFHLSRNVIKLPLTFVVPKFLLLVKAETVISNKTENVIFNEKCIHIQN